jgi:hypothetical protein
VLLDLLSAEDDLVCLASNVASDDTKRVRPT